MHRSRPGAGRVVAAAANALVRESEFDAAALDRGEVEKVKILGALALKLNESCPSWCLCTEATTLGEAPRGKGRWSAKDKSNWLLSQKEGIFVAQPASKGASNTHIVAVDAGAELLCDPIEPVAWKFCKESLAASTGEPETYVGIGEIRRLAKQRAGSPLLKRSPRRRGRKSRGKKQRQE